MADAPEELDPNWWPQLLAWIRDENPLDEDPVLVAQIVQPHGENSYRQLFTALCEPDIVSDLVRSPTDVGYRVDASGPHPSSQEGEHEPWFLVQTAAPGGLEPLVLSWASGSSTSLVIDPHFLMTYGLTPRLSGGDIHWDDPQAPEYSVAVVKPRSDRSFPTVSHAEVRVREAHLRHYAGLRGKSLVQVYYADEWGEETPELSLFLGSRQQRTAELEGREIRVVRASRTALPILTEVRGVRLLMDPEPPDAVTPLDGFPILDWPGVGSIESQEEALSLLDAHAIVSDSVLGRFESREEFAISPEFGAVSFGNQWSVGHVQRFERDLLSLDLKKLYEGNRSDIIKHFHAYAIEPTPGPWWSLSDVPNVATRSRRVVEAVCVLGSKLAGLVSAILGRSFSSDDLVGYEWSELDYSGWWTDERVAPITNHIPLDLNEHDFLSRCSDLAQAVVEGIPEALIRQTLEAVGVPSDAIQEDRSVLLLGRLAALARDAVERGVVIATNSAPEPEQVETLLALVSLRNVSDHSIRGRKKRQLLATALDVFGVTPGSTQPGWGLALDTVYDRTGDSLERLAATFE